MIIVLTKKWSKSIGNHFPGIFINKGDQLLSHILELLNQSKQALLFSSSCSFTCVQEPFSSHLAQCEQWPSHGQTHIMTWDIHSTCPWVLTLKVCTVKHKDWTLMSLMELQTSPKIEGGLISKSLPRWRQIRALLKSCLVLEKDHQWLTHYMWKEKTRVYLEITSLPA